MPDETPLPSELLAEMPSGLILFHLARQVKIGKLSPEKAAAIYLDASRDPKDAAAQKEGGPK